MAKVEDKIIGYIALHSSMMMFCEEDACVISVSQTALNRLLKSSGQNPTEFQKRKTALSTIVEGMAMGGVYAFDVASFKVFKKSAKLLNFEFSHELKKSVLDGIEYYYVYPNTPL